MKKKFLGMLVALLCMSGSAVAQESRREALIDSIANLSLGQLTRLNMMDAAKQLTEENVGLDPITAEAIYAKVLKNTIPLIAESYSQFTEEQLEEICRFMNSEANRRISSSEVSETVGVMLAADMMGLLICMIDGSRWDAEIPELHDKEYDALVDKYMEQTNVLSIFDSMMTPLMENLKDEMGASGMKMLTSIMDQMQHNYPKYYKCALVNYVSKEQLQEVVDFYNKPYMVKIQQDAETFATALIGEVMKDPEAFATQVSELLAQLGAVKDTATVVKEYIEQLPSMPIYNKIEPIRPVKTLAMKKKATYTGQTRDGQAYGKGVLTDKKGIRYSGDFKNDKRHGLITTYYTNGDSITQVWADDKVMKVQNANIKMAASYYKDKPMGDGFAYEDGVKKEGLFIDGELQGDGKATSNEGESIEEGWFENGVLIKGHTIEHGYGNSTEFNGEQYETLIHGAILTGTLKVIDYSDGVKASIAGQGVFINGELNGVGVTETEAKSVNLYDKGCFAYNKLYGDGHRTIKKDGVVIEVYDGEFFAGKYQGKGIRKEYSRNEKYDMEFTKITDAEFRKGEVNGEMVYEEYITNISGGWTFFTFTRFGFKMPYSDSRLTPENSNSEAPVIRIKGTATDGKLNGEAEITLSNGDYYKGTFRNGEFVEGIARITYSDSSMYEGEMKNGKYEGKGKYTEAYGFSDEGTFMYGTCVDGVRKNKRGTVLYKIR